MATWQLQEAKAKLSAVLDAVRTEGAQIITRHGIKEAVVIPFAEWKPADEPQKSALEILRGQPPYFDIPLPDRKKRAIARSRRFNCNTFLTQM